VHFFLLFFSAFLIGITPSETFAQPRLPDGIHTSVVAGLDLILQQKYDNAEQHFSQLSAEFPTHPAGPLYHAAVLQAKSLDYGSVVDRQAFDSLIALGRSRALGLSDHVDDLIWKKYFEATADGYEAVDRVERGNWFGGVRKAMSSADAFEELLDADSTFADTRVGIGTYLYWRSRKTEFIHWLPFISDDRKKGIDHLIRGAVEGEYNKFAAISALISVLTDASSYDEAVRWAETALRFYPTNRIFLWGRATALHRSGKFALSIPAYETLLKSILNSGSPVPYDEIVCRLNLVKCQRTTGDTTGGREHLDAICSLKGTIFPEALAERARAKFEEARILRSSPFRQ
jgi:tetratricopeptide (TPR) repeat protein